MMFSLQEDVFLPATFADSLATLCNRVSEIVVPRIAQMRGESLPLGST